jgi:hypothetical protein
VWALKHTKIDRELRANETAAIIHRLDFSSDDNIHKLSQIISYEIRVSKVMRNPVN